MICMVTGHRSKGFPFERKENDYRYTEYLNKLKCEIEKIIEEGCVDFVTGMAEGADIDFAKCVLSCRAKRKEKITLEAALPYSMPLHKSQNERDDVLEDCDFVTTVSEFYHRGCMQKRNCYMVDKADVVLAIWNGECDGGTWNTIKYARSKRKDIRYIMLNEI